jgi:hypothetical protein
MFDPADRRLFRPWPRLVWFGRLRRCAPDTSPWVRIGLFIRDLVESSFVGFVSLLFVLQLVFGLGFLLPSQCQAGSAAAGRTTSGGTTRRKLSIGRGCQRCDHHRCHQALHGALQAGDSRRSSGCVLRIHQLPCARKRARRNSETSSAGGRNGAIRVATAPLHDGSSAGVRSAPARAASETPAPWWRPRPA